MQAQHADHSIERHDRRRQRCADAAICQLADVAEGWVVQLGGLEYVTDRDRAALPGSQVDRGQPACVAESRDARRRPRCEHRRRLAGLAEADEAALDVRRLRRLLDRDLEQLVEIATRPDSARDPRDQPLSLESVRDRVCGARPLERETRLGRQRLHQHELVEVEKPWTADGGEDDADHVAANPHRNKRAALDLRNVVQPLVHDRRALGVVHREGGAFANDRADAGHLLAQRNGLPDQLLIVLAVIARGDDAGSPAVVLDERKVCDIELEEPRQLVQEDAPNSVRAFGVEQPVREATDYCELAVPARRLLLGLLRAAGRGHEQAEVAPIAGDGDERQGCEKDAEQGN